MPPNGHPDFVELGCSIFIFLCSIVDHFLSLIFLTIVLSLLQLTVSDYPYDIFKRILHRHNIVSVSSNVCCASNDK